MVDANRRAAKRPLKPWRGQPCAVIASGPSLAWDDYADVDLVQQSGIKTIVVNSTWERARFADVLYAGDMAWWRHNHKKIDIPAARWSMSRAAENLYSATRRDRFVKGGYNSGANAIELAVNVYNASAVLLLGFDCSLKHGSHHHGEHKKCKNPAPDGVEQWKDQFEALLTHASRAPIINCSRYTALDMFPKRDLRQTLCELGLTCATPTTPALPCSAPDSPGWVTSQSTA